MSSESLSHLMQATTKALYDCQLSLDRGGSVGAGAARSINVDQAEHLLQLMETLVATKNELTTEISSDRFRYIDPKIVNEMKAAIAMAISNPIDAKVNQIYFSIFGYNSTLWHVLKEMQKLLKTVEFHEERKQTKIVGVHQAPQVKRKKRHEKGGYAEDEKEEK
jgi:hypothetical protein